MQCGRDEGHVDRLVRAVREGELESRPGVSHTDDVRSGDVAAVGCVRTVPFEREHDDRTGDRSEQGSEMGGRSRAENADPPAGELVHVAERTVRDPAAPHLRQPRDRRQLVADSGRKDHGASRQRRAVGEVGDEAS